MERRGRGWVVLCGTVDSVGGLVYRFVIMC
jgi:hypothetical protein